MSTDTPAPTLDELEQEREEAEIREWLHDLVERATVGGDWHERYGALLCLAAEHLAALRSPAPVEQEGTALNERESVQGVVFVLLDGMGRVLMEKCPKKAAMYGGEWFIPGGRIEAGETPEQAVGREVTEELGVDLVDGYELPLVDCSGGGARPSFLVRPYVFDAWDGEVPDYCLDHPEVPLRWVPLDEARRSPCAAVRAIIAPIPDRALSTGPAPSGGEREEALQTLAAFAKTAPGRLPQHVQDALALASAPTSLAQTPCDCGWADCLCPRDSLATHSRESEEEVQS